MKQYPEQIQTKVNIALEVMQDFILQEQVDQDILSELLAEALFPKFISGDELAWSEEEITNLMQLSVINTLIEELKTKGYVESVEGEDGEEYLWQTEKSVREIEERESKKKTKKKKK